MRSLRIPLFAAALLAAPAALAQQALVCAGSAPSPCEAFHYHVQMYRPDTRQFVEITAANRFASDTACNRAREAQQKRAAAVGDYFRQVKGEQRYEADRIGPCHCDLTEDKASPSYLPDAQRTMQLRTAEEVRLRVREKLLDVGLLTDNELVRGLWADEPVTPILAGPRFVPLPQSAPVPPLTSAEDLRPTRTIDTSKPVVAALNLPLVDILEPAPPPPPPPAEGEAVVATDSGSTTVADAATAPQAAVPQAIAPAPQETMTEQPVAAEPAPAVPNEQPEQVVEARNEEEELSAEEASASFISYETERINNVLKASAAIADEGVKSKIFEACMQRINLLSNLKLLIEGSGVRSRLATAARTAQTEEERLAVVAKLFGDDIHPHWAPKDAADVVFPVSAEIATEPERALRDSSGRFSSADKKHALYTLLAQSQPTEEQRLWLTTVIDRFLQ